MTREELYEKLKTFEGVEVGTPTAAPDPVNEPMIRHWCDAVDDRNPVYTDPEFASRSVHGGLVAPPTMLQAWTMRGLRPPPKPEGAAPGPQFSLFAPLTSKLTQYGLRMNDRNSGIFSCGRFGNGVVLGFFGLSDRGGLRVPATVAWCTFSS